MRKEKLLILCLGLLLNSCTFSNSNVINDNNLIIDPKWQISYQEIFTISPYYLYVYSPTCPHCNEIKNKMIGFAMDHEDIIKYLEYTSEIPIKSTANDLIGIVSLDDFFIYGYPLIIEFEDFGIVNYYLGVNNILDFINSF